MDDSQLLHEYIERNSNEAFGEFVRRHVDLVYSAALRQCGGNHHQAQEVTQMVFTDLAKKAKKLAKHPLLLGWLHTSVRCAARELQRSETRRNKRMQQLAATEDLCRNPSNVPDWEKLKPSLDQALESLRERDREAVLLRYFQNQSFIELGRRFGVSENTARMRVERALDKLQISLKRRGIVSTASALAVVLSHNAVQAAPAGLAGVVSTTACAAATGGAAAVTTLSLGSLVLMKKIHAIILGGLCIGLGVGCYLERQAAAAITSRLAAAEARVSQARNDAKQKSQLVEGLQKKLQDRQTAKEAARAADPLAQRYSYDMIVRRGELDQQYLWLFRRLGLPREKLNKLKDLIVERNQAIFDAEKMSQLQGLDIFLPSERRAFNLVATSDIDARIAKALGADVLQRVQEYSSERNFGFQIAALLETGTTAGAYLSGIDRKNTFSVSKCSLENLEKAEAMSARITASVGSEMEAHADACYLANEMLPFPEALLQKLDALLPREITAQLRIDNEDVKAKHRMVEIERKAAYEGRLNLPAKVAAEYGVSPKAKNQAGNNN